MVVLYCRGAGEKAGGRGGRRDRKVREEYGRVKEREEKKREGENEEEREGKEGEKESEKKAKEERKTKESTAPIMNHITLTHPQTVISRG